jgi:type IV secretion system protein VirD4
MSQVDRYLQQQQSKYRSRQPELLWPVLLAIALGLLLASIPVIIAQNRIASDFHHDPLLGRPTMGRLYLSPTSYLAWKARCRHSRNRYSAAIMRFPACRDEARAKVILSALGRYDRPVFLSSSILFGSTVMLGFAVRNRRREKMRVQTHGDAKWATFDELAKANLILSKRKSLASEKGKIGFPLGVVTHGRRRYYVYTNPQEALGVMLVGPPGSGKTSCFYIPHLLTDATSKFVYDPSLEMWRKTSGWRSLPRERGGAGNITLLFAPSQPEISCHINPLDAIKWETPREIATLQNFWKRLLDYADKAAEGPEAHWIATGSVLAECTALHLHYTDPENCTGEGVYNYLARFEDSDDGAISGADVALQEMMRTPHDPEFRLGWVDDDGDPTPVHPYVVRSARETLQKAPNEKSGVISTTRRFLHFFRDPQVAKVTGDSSLSLEDLMLNKRPVSLYFGIAPRDAQRLRPLVGLLINLITFEHMGDDALNLETGKFRWVHPLDLNIDEAAQLKKQEQLFLNFSMARKYGIGPNLGYQDISQVWSAAGGQHEEAVTSVSNYKVILRPNKPETAKWISEELLGKTTGQDFIRNFSGNRLGYLGHAMTQQNYMATNLMSPQALMDMPPHIAVVKAGDVSPFVVETLYYESDPKLKARSDIPPPKKSMVIPMEDRAYQAPWLVHSLRRRKYRAGSSAMTGQGAMASGTMMQARSPLQKVDRDAAQNVAVEEDRDGSAQSPTSSAEETAKDTSQRQTAYDVKNALDQMFDM